MSTESKMKMRKGTAIAIITAGCTIVAAALAVVLWLTLAYIPAKREHDKLLGMLRDYYDAKVAAFAEENAALPAEQVEIVFLGDSLTDGYDLSTYLPQYAALNRGIGGDTTFGLQNRLDVSLYAVRPKVAVMLIGVNNLDTMTENYESIVKEIRTRLPDTKLVLLSLTSMAGDWARNNEKAAYRSALIKRYAAENGCAFVDVYTPLLDTATGEMRAEYTTDGGHFTPAGYEVITAAIAPTLAELLGH